MTGSVDIGPTLGRVPVVVTRTPLPNGERLMRIQFRIVGTIEQHNDVWVDLPVVPREGEAVKLPGIPEYDTIVRTVVWYPVVDDQDEKTEPSVYVVLGSARPG